MIALGYWENGRPYFRAVVALPSGVSANVRLQVDTASNCTILSETEFEDEDDVNVGCFQTVPVETLAGKLPAYLARNGSVGLWDVTKKLARISPVDFFLIKGIKTNFLQRFILRKILGVGRVIEPPRYILGRDVLNKYHLIMRQPDLVLLTDNTDECMEYIRTHFGLNPPMLTPFGALGGESSKLYIDPKS